MTSFELEPIVSRKLQIVVGVRGRGLAWDCSTRPFKYTARRHRSRNCARGAVWILDDYAAVLPRYQVYQRERRSREFERPCSLR
jgi:hypothetical protein